MTRKDTSKELVTLLLGYDPTISYRRDRDITEMIDDVINKYALYADAEDLE